MEYYGNTKPSVNLSVIRLSSLDQYRPEYPETAIPVTVHDDEELLSSRENHRRTGLMPNERQLSLLDPTSDRVSTILVWKNLTVLTREDKSTEFFQRLKFWKKFVPKRLRLLNNISGAITGGLWAVMGNSNL